MGSYMIIIGKFHNHRLVQVGRWLRRSLIQPPAQSRANTKCRSGCLGLCPDRSCKTPRMELPQHLWEAFSTANCPQRENCFLIHSLNFPCSNLWSLSVILLTSTYVPIFFFYFPVNTGNKTAVRCPQNLSSKLNKPRSSAFSWRSYIPALPAILLAFLPWIHSNLSTSFWYQVV